MSDTPILDLAAALSLIGWPAFLVLGYVACGLIGSCIVHIVWPDE